MSLSAAELQQHCQAIISLSKISHRMIILCEGDINAIKGRVHLYRRMETLPDANFYKACIPQWWTEKKPIFVPCGDKEDVLNTYFALRETYQNKIYKLFAIIDLDLQPAKKLKNYPIADTEQLFNTLYQKNITQLENIKQNPIFITGLIYKEAYFFTPDLQTLFDNYTHPILFNEQPIQLNSLYQLMLNSLSTDKNIGANFKTVCNRINYLNELDFTNIDTLQQSWLNAFNLADEEQKTQLIHALLSIHQVKDYWKAIKSNENEIIEERFKEQLTLAIGNFYATLDRHSEHHLPSFFNALSANT
jgi:hypothetical protein